MWLLVCGDWALIIVSEWVVVFTLHAGRHRVLVFCFVDIRCYWVLGIGYLVPQCFDHTLCPLVYGSWHWVGIGFRDYRGLLKIMGYQDGSRLLGTTKSQFGKQKTVPYCDRFCYGNSLPPVLKRKRNGHLYGERNGNVVFKQDSSV